MRILLFVLPLILALGACSTYTARSEFDETAKAYGNMVRWDKFETANLFAASSIRDEFEKRLKDAKNVEVVDYQITSVEYDQAKNTATVNAEISYHPLSSNRVRTLIDKQVWLYGEENGLKRWRLTTVLPEFK